MFNASSAATNESQRAQRIASQRQLLESARVVRTEGESWLLRRSENQNSKTHAKRRA